MNIPPLSGPQSSDFVNPYTSIETVISELEKDLNALVSKVNAVVDSTRKELDTQTLSQVAGSVRMLEQCSLDADRAVGDSQTIITVKKYVQELFHVLSPSGASILDAVKEDDQENPPTTEHLKTTLEKLSALPFALRRLVEELELIAQDLHTLKNPRRHIG